MVGSYQELGVKTYINALGTATIIGGSLMPLEVRQAMLEAADHFVDLDELHQKAGQHLARLIGAPAAYVCSGAAGGLTLAAAACMAGADPARIAQLPATIGMRDEVVVPQAHRTDWEQAFRQAGASIVEAGNTAQAVEAACGERTAAIAFFVAYSHAGGPSLRELAAVGRAAGVPVIVDAAAELPPASNLTAFLEQGADLVVFSGGKGLRGPQCTGLILGRPDLVEACRLNASPHHSICRPMKVGKEEVMGLVRAVELYLARDHEAERATWQAMAAHIAQSVEGIPGVAAQVTCGQVPAAVITLAPEASLNAESLSQALRAGEPGIVVGRSAQGIVINPHVMCPGEEQVVGARLVELLRPPGGA